MRLVLVEMLLIDYVATVATVATYGDGLWA